MAGGPLGESLLKKRAHNGQYLTASPNESGPTDPVGFRKGLTLAVDSAYRARLPGSFVIHASKPAAPEKEEGGREFQGVWQL